MDPVTHGLAGIVIARAGFSNSLKKLGPVTGLLTALSPDSDILLRYFGEEVFLRYHRGITHSLILLPVYSLILAFIFQRVFRKKEGYIFFYLLCFLSLLSHIILDLMTSFGTMAFSPWTDKRMSWDLIFIIDPWFTGAMLIPLLIAFYFKNYKRELAILSIGLVIGYTGLCMFNHHKAVTAAEMLFKEKGRDVLTHYTIAAIPQPFSPFKWQVLIDTGDSLYQSFINENNTSGGNILKNMVWKKWPDSPYVEKALKQSGVRFYLWFARFPVVMERIAVNGNHLVEFVDLRFDMQMGRVPFTYIVEFNNEGVVLLEKFTTINLNNEML
ncbi:MAG: metal-dependent hydrolase [Nitrospirae bacterium]|nr:metal-dependent hydrolase [Nitrospirota bacterium]